MSKKSQDQQEIMNQTNSNRIISSSKESLNIVRYNPFSPSSDEMNSSPKNNDNINIATPSNSNEISLSDEKLNNSNDQKKLKEDLTINTENKTNNNLIENDTEIPKPKNTEDLFDSIHDDKNGKKEQTWFNRDGRKEKDEYADNALKKIMSDHEKMYKLKQDISNSISELESIQFNMYYVKVYSKEAPVLLKDKLRPRIKFENLKKVPEILNQNLKILNYEYLTPVQRVIMPYIQYGKDIVCITETGSGKTLSYLFAIIGQMLIQGVPENPYLIKDEFYKIYDDKENNEDKNKDLFKNVIAYPICLIIVPSRELAIQISKESKKLAQNTGIKTVDIIGGDKRLHQLIELSKGCDILVCTPMRLQQYINSGKVNLKMVKYLVLDEADKMLGYEFYEQLKNIFDKLPEKRFRQNLLFSATLNDDVKGIANYCLNNYYYFNSVKECPKTIKHLFINCKNTADKFENLIQFLKKDENKEKNILIFVNNKKGVDDMMKAFQEENIRACSIHGAKTQIDRNRAIRDFSLGFKRVLISTDLISRGIDFPYVYCVINFDVPDNIEDYIHRIGRAGRLGQKGLAITYLDRIDDTNKDSLINLLSNLGQEIPPWINDIEYRKNTDYLEQKKESFLNRTNISHNNNKNDDWNDNANNNNYNNNRNSWNDNANNINNDSGWGDNSNNNFNNNRQRRNNNNNPTMRNRNNNSWNNQNNGRNNDGWNDNNNSGNSFNNNNNFRNNDRQRNNHFNNHRNNNNNNSNNSNNNYESRRNNNFNPNMNNRNNNNYNNNNRNNRNPNNNFNRKNNQNNHNNNNNRDDWDNNNNNNNNSNDQWDSTNNNPNNNNSALPDDVNEELFIRGINYKSEEDDIKNTFSKYGQIVFCKIIRDKETNKSKGIGIVKFQEKSQAFNAMKDADNIECQGRKLKINYSTKNNNNRDNRSFNKNNFGDNNNRNRRNFQNRNRNNNNNVDKDNDDGWNERNNERERSREKENNNIQSNNDEGVDSW